MLERLHGHRGDNFPLTELAEIRAQLAIERQQRRHWAITDIFTQRYIRRTLLGTFILNMTKLSGSGIISNYQSLFYGGLGYKGNTVLLLSGIYGFMGVFGQIFNLIWVSDKISRRMTVCKLPTQLASSPIILC